ncbi:MAG: DUF1127 domain-containing protein [Geminicoccaceae bacterium]
MAADHGNHGATAPIRRLVRALAAWRRRRAMRRRARLHGFIGLSDRTLADIGLRRADVHGALLGAMPLRQHAIAQESTPGPAICQLPRRPRLTVVSNDLSAAA